MYSNILVAVDFNEERAPDAALGIAKALANDAARITLLHVMEAVPNYVVSYMPEGYLDELHDAVRGELEKAAASLPSGHAAIVHGKPADEILAYAEAHGADCIVLASHKPGMQDYFLGSTASRVVRHATCAVHVIR